MSLCGKFGHGDPEEGHRGKGYVKTRDRDCKPRIVKVADNY